LQEFELPKSFKSFVKGVWDANILDGRVKMHGLLDWEDELLINLLPINPIKLGILKAEDLKSISEKDFSSLGVILKPELSSDVEERMDALRETVKQRILKSFDLTYQTNDKATYEKLIFYADLSSHFGSTPMETILKNLLEPLIPKDLKKITSQVRNIYNFLKSLDSSLLNIEFFIISRLYGCDSYESIRNVLFNQCKSAMLTLQPDDLATAINYLTIVKSEFNGSEPDDKFKVKDNTIPECYRVIWENYGLN
jgi:hypothetical protein